MAGSIALCVLCLSWVLPAHPHAGIHDRIEAASRRIAERPSDPAAYIRRAHLLAEHDEWEEAFADLDRAAERTGSQVAVDFERALLLYQWSRRGGEGRLRDQALHHVNRFLEAQPDHADALLLRARLHRGLEQPQTALADYDRSIALTEAPRPELFVEQARLLEALGRSEQAVAVLERSVVPPGSPSLLVVRTAIDLETRLGNPRAAVKWFERLPPVLKTQPNELMLKGDLLRAAGEEVQAQAVYCDALERLAAFPPGRRERPVFADLDTRLYERLAGVGQGHDSIDETFVFQECRENAH